MEPGDLDLHTHRGKRYDPTLLGERPQPTDGAGSSLGSVGLSVMPWARILRAPELGSHAPPPAPLAANSWPLGRVVASLSLVQAMTTAAWSPSS